VKCAKAQVPPQRLVVVAAPNAPTELLENVQEASCPVNADGTFELAQPTGTRVLRVLDILTGVPLGDDVECNVEADKRCEVDVAVEVAEVRLHLQDEEAGEGGPGTRLVPVADQQPQTLRNMMYPQQIGIDLRDAGSELTLYLRPGSTSFRVERGALGMQNAQWWFAGSEPEGDLVGELDVVPGPPQELNVKIPRRAVGRR
jgi:hypothetical protein